MTSSPEWSDDLLVGVDVIDEQHRRLIAICNAITDEAGRGTLTDQRFHELFNNLMAQTLVHFDTEEALLRERGAPGYADHAREHGKFIDTLSNIAMDSFATRIDQEALIRYMVHWVGTHIVKTDQRDFNGGGTPHAAP